MTPFPNPKNHFLFYTPAQGRGISVSPNTWIDIDTLGDKESFEEFVEYENDLNEELNLGLALDENTLAQRYRFDPSYGEIHLALYRDKRIVIDIDYRGALRA